MDNKLKIKSFGLTPQRLNDFLKRPLVITKRLKFALSHFLSLVPIALASLILSSGVKSLSLLVDTLLLLSLALVLHGGFYTIKYAVEGLLNETRKLNG